MVPSTDLRASLEKHNTDFEALLKLIPAKYYLVNEENRDQVRKSRSTPFMQTKLIYARTQYSKYQKNKKGQTGPKQAVKEASKKAKRDKARRVFPFPRRWLTPIDFQA